MISTRWLRVRQWEGRVRPMYLNVGSQEMLERAGEAIGLYVQHRECSRGELSEATAILLRNPGDPKIVRGFLDVLEDRSTFSSPSGVDPVLLRQRVFQEGARGFPVGTPGREDARREILGTVGREFDLAPDQVESSLFSDLKDQQIMTEFKELEPLDLVHRYNVGLAQSLLLLAYRMDIVLEEVSTVRLRQLFRYLKFFRLLFSVVVGEDGTTRLSVDGPRSVLSETRGYGVRLAAFLPALLLVEGFSMVAPVLWKNRRTTFHLSHKEGLRSHYRDTGTWRPPELEAFLSRLQQQLPRDAVLTEGSNVFSLKGREVYVPDVEVHCPSGDLSLEIVWPWRKINWSRFYPLFAEYAPPGAHLLVPRKLVPAGFAEKCRDRRILFYRATPVVTEFLERLGR